MAFLHCHNTACNFSQDDFWTKQYNPITCFWTRIDTYALPRWIEYDFYMVKDMHLVWGTRPAMQRGRIAVHSWRMLLYSIKVLWRRFRGMHYWTYAAWKRAVNDNGGKWPPCPKCGQAELDID